MTTISIKKENALKAYGNASKSEKKLLEDLFGKDVINQNIMDVVKSFEDALRLSPQSNEVLQFLCLPVIDARTQSIVAGLKLMIIAEALNEGWEADWEDSDQYKYYPYFTHKSGFGLSFAAAPYVRSCAVVGSRLCYKSEELAIYAGKQFEQLYKTYLSKQP